MGRSVAVLNRAAIDHPANAALRRYCEARYAVPGAGPLARSDDVADPYMNLGTHPDLVARLWDELGSRLPTDCRAIFFGAPALVHPSSGIVFGFAGGTHTYALRLPEPERIQAVHAGATRVMKYPVEPDFDLDDVGTEWVFCGWFPREEAWCRAAFDFAALPP